MSCRSSNAMVGREYDVREIPLEVQAAYGLLWTDRSDDPVHVPSLINHTYLVQADGGHGPRRLVLQRLHPVFSPNVHVDIQAVTQHLVRRSVETPVLLRNRSGDLWTLEACSGRPRIWRAMSYIDGIAIHRSNSLKQLASAGAVLGRFHAALLDLKHEFVHVHHLHDTARHLDTLRATLASERGRDDAEVQDLGARVLEHAQHVRLDYREFPKRVLHGDPKLSNLLFDPAEPTRARCLIDLDTLCRGYLAYELGDALRSWGNPVGEDAPQADFDGEALRAVITGYARSCPTELTDAEICSGIDGLQTVSLELASRLAADAILDNYFGWDAKRFPSRRAHNLVRARGQLSLACSIRNQADELHQIARKALAARQRE
jgi:Ser/Thr protein kinase RdoA (MazF antagonist)